MRQISFVIAALLVSWLARVNDGHAQVAIEYRKMTKNSTLTITAGSGVYYGYGYYGAFSPGIVLQRGNSTILFGTNFSGSSLPLYVNPYSARSFLYGSGYYYPYLYRYSLYPGLSSPLFPSYPRDPSPIFPEPVAKKDRLSSAMSAQGKAFLKEGKYAEAEKALRGAIGSGREDPEEKFLFGIALMGQGEYAYAAKAVRRSLEGVGEHGWIEAINGDALFKDTAEMAKQIGALQKRSRLGDVDSSLLLTILLFLSGDNDGAAKEAVKLSADPVCGKLRLFMSDARLR